MSRGEKAFVLFYAAYMLAYIPCFFLLLPRYVWQVMPFHLFGMLLGIPLLIIVFRDLYKRQFPNPNTKLTWAILIFVFWPSMIVYLCKHGFHPRPSPDDTVGDVTEPQHSSLPPARRWYQIRLRWLLMLLVPSLLVPVALAIIALFGERYAKRVHNEACLAPPVLPVSLRIVYQGETMLRGSNCVAYSGTAIYTFRNEQPFPVTLAFPPICYYTYSHSKEVTLTLPPIFSSTSSTTWQGSPYPDEKRAVPDFAREQRDVVIPARQTVTFTSPFNIGCADGEPAMNHVFVFGVPRLPCAHPVLGTVYGMSVEYTGMPKDLTSTEYRPTTNQRCSVANRPPTAPARRAVVMSASSIVACASIDFRTADDGSSVIGFLPLPSPHGKR
jgi:hypothetical protein